MRPVAGGTARRPADGPGGRRVGLPAVPIRRRLSVRVARPRLGPSVPGRDARRVWRVRAPVEPVQDRDEPGRRWRRRDSEIFGFPVERGHGRGDQRRLGVPESPAAALLRLRAGPRPAGQDAVRQGRSAQLASYARRAGQQVVQLGGHGGPERGVRCRVQGVRRGRGRQAVFLPPESLVPGQHGARGRPHRVRRRARLHPVLGRHAHAVQVDRVRGVRHHVPRPFLAGRSPSRVRRASDPERAGRRRAQVRYSRPEDCAETSRFRQNVRLTNSPAPHYTHYRCLNNIPYIVVVTCYCYLIFYIS